MSKYNNIISIPIEDIPEEEIEIAIKEWAEGDESMERLLWTCYRNKVKTTGCHAGSHSYIGIEYEEKNKDKIVQLLSTVINVKETRVVLSPDGGNPFGGPTWYKPNIAMGSDTEYKDEADLLFDMISDELNNNEKQNTDYSSVIDLYNFLIGKYSGILIRILHTQNDEYIFSMERHVAEEEMSNLNEFFSSAGLTFVDDDFPIKTWEFKTTNKEEFIENLNTISKNIINNYSLRKPESIEEAPNLKIKAHIVRDKYIREGNESGFELWLMEEDERAKERRAKAYAEWQKRN